MSETPAGTGRRVFSVPTDDDTERLGAAFAATLQPLATRALRAWLAGDLGAGKTTFARGLLRRLGVAGAVRSPTYSLIERYAPGALEVIHGDLYRLEGAQELATLGLDEFDRASALWLIEWPERGKGVLPTPDLECEFSVEASGHRIVVTARSEPGARWLARLPVERP